MSAVRKRKPIDVESLNAIKLSEIGKALNIQIEQGRSIRCPLPRHDDQRASCQYWPDTNRWWCHACGEGGDNINLVISVLGCSFIQAVDFIKKYFPNSEQSYTKIHVNLSRPEAGSKKYPVAHVDSTTARIYELLRNNLKVTDRLISYFGSRAINFDTLIQFEVGEIVDLKFLEDQLSSFFKHDEIKKSGLLWPWSTPERPSFCDLKDRAIFPFLNKNACIYIQGRKLNEYNNEKYLWKFVIAPEMCYAGIKEKCLPVVDAFPSCITYQFCT